MAESATHTYSAAVATLQEEEARLAVLRQRRDGGEKLSRNDFVDMLQLESEVEHARREVAVATPAMRAEQEALDIQDIVEIGNGLVDPQVKAFEAWVHALAALWTARDTIIATHRKQSAIMNNVPAFRNLQLATPTGEEVFRNLLSRLPDAAAWMQIFLSPHSAPLTTKQVAEMAAVYTTLRPPTVGALTRQVQAQRRR